MFGVISVRFLSVLYTRANTESYEDLWDKEGPLLYGINRANNFTELTSRWDLNTKQKVVNKNVLKWMFSHLPYNRSSASRNDLRTTVLASYRPRAYALIPRPRTCN